MTIESVSKTGEHFFSISHSATYIRTDSHKNKYEKVSEDLSYVEKYWICVWKRYSSSQLTLVIFFVHDTLICVNNFKKIYWKQNNNLLFDYPEFGIFKNWGHKVLKMKSKSLLHQSATQKLFGVML